MNDAAIIAVVPIITRPFCFVNDIQFLMTDTHRGARR